MYVLSKMQHALWLAIIFATTYHLCEKIPHLIFVNFLKENKLSKNWPGPYQGTWLKLCIKPLSPSINPSSPNSDQHQFSPNNIHMLPREMVMRVNEMITKEKMLKSVIKLSQLRIL